MRLLNLYTIATKPGFLGKAFDISPALQYEPAFQARPGMTLPVVMSQEPALKSTPARWGDGQGRHRNPFVPIETVLTKRPFNRWIRTRRCIVPANCFFAERSGKVYCIRILGERLFGMGALLTSDGGHSEPPAFSLLSCASADVLRDLTPRLPVIIRIADTRKWLDSSHVETVMRFADDSASQWFDFFEVSTQVADPDVNDAQLLTPIGLSNAQLREREERLQAIKYREDRIIRRNTKGR